MVFDKKIPALPMSLVYKTLMLSKAWRPLLKPKLKPLAEDMLNLISAKAAGVGLSVAA